MGWVVECVDVEGGVFPELSLSTNVHTFHTRVRTRPPFTFTVLKPGERRATGCIQTKKQKKGNLFSRMGWMGGMMREAFADVFLGTHARPVSRCMGRGASEYEYKMCAQ